METDQGGQFSFSAQRTVINTIYILFCRTFSNAIKDITSKYVSKGKALFVWGGLAHLGGMFLSFCLEDIFHPM